MTVEIIMNCFTCFDFFRFCSFSPTLLDPSDLVLKPTTAADAQPLIEEHLASAEARFSSDKQLARQLFDAVYDGDEHSVGELLAKRADPNVPFGGFQSTALLAAAKTGNPRLVGHLLRAGANVAVRDAENRSAFQVARDEEVLRVLEAYRN